MDLRWNDVIYILKGVINFIFNSLLEIIINIID
jgi:hypothetical protein